MQKAIQKILEAAGGRNPVGYQESLVAKRQRGAVRLAASLMVASTVTGFGIAGAENFQAYQHELAVSVQPNQPAEIVATTPDTQSVEPNQGFVHQGYEQP